jgi:Replication-relaxation
MIANQSTRVGRSKRPSRLRQGALIALQVLETCPLVTVDAFVHLAGLTSLSSAYQQLGRLRCAGLADVRRIDPGYLVGERRLGCWTITDEGRRALAGALGRNNPGQQADMPPEKPGAGGAQSRLRIPDSEMPLLIATYRVLAFLMFERATRGQAIEVHTWEWPWVREAWSAADWQVLRVRMPAGATLKLREPAITPDSAAQHLITVVLVPDLGTAPVVRYREMLRRLVTLRGRGMLADCLADVQFEVVIATLDAGGAEARSRAWQEQLDAIVRRHGTDAVQMRVISWDRVADMLKRTRSPDLVAADRPHTGPSARGTPHIVRWPAPARSREQLLHLIGRHPCLTVDQLAMLLGTALGRVRRLEGELIEDGFLRRIGFEELPPGATSFGCEQLEALGLVEITAMGRRQVAGWLGLTPASANRYHGLNGNGRTDAGRRWRLLRALRHTLGTNGVFVAFAVAAETARRAGGSDDFAVWRSAAGCERRHCKPDGYGCYVRDGLPHGFFLEYDRGTESRRNYAAKFRAYHRYRDSTHVERDYDGFPTLLFVTTDVKAELRISEEAVRAYLLRDTEPLPVLITTTGQIASDTNGILGAIWRTPASVVAGSCDRRRWPQGGSTRIFDRSEHKSSRSPASASVRPPTGGAFHSKDRPA